MSSRPGFTGRLNTRILARVRTLSRDLQLPDLEQKFSHLLLGTGSWRAPPPGDNVNLAAYIDHTLLKPDATEAEVLQLCKEARQYGFYAVCVNGSRVRLCVDALRKSGVRTAVCCGFPLGSGCSAAKAAEARRGVEDGALDVDMVINVGAVKDKNYLLVYKDIKSVVDACGPRVTTKVILETCLLDENEIIDCCILAVAAGASYVKTSTGFNRGGATPEVVDVMLAVVGNAAKVKASGGVRDRAVALQFVQAGVSRIGTSSGVAIVSNPLTRSTSKY
ncbi:putative DeoC LacD family aldolase [Trypanosoma vivax]|nr:putative DeoC LacD family aldolase [Trypanosoma vivax]